MGLAASQARALLLVARKSDIEYRMQCLTQRKMVLALQTEQIAKDYSTKINKKKMMFVYNVDTSNNETIKEDLSYASLILNANYIGQYRVTDAMGRVVVPSYDYIPQQEVEVPLYTKVSQGEDGSETAAMKTETVPTTTTKSLGVSSGTDNNGNKIYPEIYLPTNTDEGFVKIQNSDGTLNINASVVNGNNTTIPVFSKTGEGSEATTANYTMTSDLQNWNKYEMVTTSSVDSSYNFGSAAEAEAAGYKQINGQTTKVLVDRQPINGKYYTDDGKEYVVAPELLNNNYLQNGLKNGALFLQKAKTTERKDALGNKIGEDTTWTTQSTAGTGVIQEVADEDLQAQAQAEYEMKTAVISSQDKIIDSEIKQLETQHKAIETEEDSVKKVIEDNIKKTFGTFKA